MAYPNVASDVVMPEEVFRIGPFRKGGDASVRLQLVADPVDPLTPGVAYVRASFTKIVYTLVRTYRGKETPVTGHIAQSLSISSVVYDALQPWRNDTRGYNFLHVIDEGDLHPLADYTIKYTFTLASPTDFDFARWAKFAYLGDDEGATPEPDDPDPDPDPDPDDGVDPLLFRSITPETVHTTAAETTLLDVADVFEVAADTWIEGGVLSGEIDGVYGTKDTSPGGITIKVKVSSVVLSFVIASGDLPNAQDGEAWSLRWSFTRITDGASGTIVGSGVLLMSTASGTPRMALASTGATPVTLDSETGAAIAHTVEWDTSDAANTITRNQFVGRMAEVPA